MNFGSTTAQQDKFFSQSKKKGNKKGKRIYCHIVKLNASFEMAQNILGVKLCAILGIVN